MNGSGHVRMSVGTKIRHTGMQLADMKTRSDLVFRSFPSVHVRIAIDVAFILSRFFLHVAVTAQDERSINLVYDQHWTQKETGL